MLDNRGKQRAVWQSFLEGAFFSIFITIVGEEGIFLVANAPLGDGAPSQDRINMIDTILRGCGRRRLVLLWLKFGSHSAVLAFDAR